MDGTQIGPLLALALLVMGLLIAMCWIILPFGILGTKPLLRQLLNEQRRTNELLAKLVAGHQAPDDRLHKGDTFSALS